MRKVREVLRLKHTLGMSLRQISEATGVGKTVTGEYVRRARVIGITWPVPDVIDDAELERRLFPVPCEESPPRAVIYWRKVHEEMKRRSVTLVLLWEEYRAEHADGYGYSRFCDLYGEWRKTVTSTMRQGVVSHTISSCLEKGRLYYVLRNFRPEDAAHGECT